MGGHPSRIFRRCSTMDIGTPVMSAGFQANTSKLSLSRLQSSILPFSDKLPPIIIVCSGYSGWIATFIPYAVAGFLGGQFEFFLSPRRTMIPLYGDGDLTTMKFIVVLVECSPSSRDTANDICPNCYDISLLNPRSGVLAGVILLFIFGRSLLKQCSNNISEADSPSTYMRWMKWPSTSASITIGFSLLSLLARYGKDISWLVEKLCVTLCFIIRFNGCIMKIVASFSLFEVSTFFDAFAYGDTRLYCSLYLPEIRRTCFCFCLPLALTLGVTL
ncbi:hypothetical protein Tco_1333615 [Tanacetum coccineum]